MAFGNNPLNRVDPTGLEDKDVVNRDKDLQTKDNSNNIESQDKSGDNLVKSGVSLILTGLVTTQVDSPAPGPADVIGVGIAAAGTAMAVVGVISQEINDTKAYLSKKEGDDLFGNEGEIEAWKNKKTYSTSEKPKMPNEIKHQEKNHRMA